MPVGGESGRLRVELPPVREGHRAVAVPPGAGGAEVLPDPASLRVFTLPNLLSILRILLVPLFVWLLVSERAFALCLVILVVSGLTDWLDGKIARFWGLQSRLGAMLDPVADRLFIAVVPVTFAIVGVLPWWVVGLLLCRDVVLAPTLVVYRRRDLVPEVVYLGKAATFALMYTFPLLLAARGFEGLAAILEPVALALLTWGVALYLWTGVLYVYRAFLVARAIAPTRGGPR